MWAEARPGRLTPEARRAVIAFGGGVLVAAIALVLVPRGVEHVGNWSALAAFGVGGVVFFAVDRMLSRKGGSAAQLIAMLLDFLPEALALGALLASGSGPGVLLALLIALQNLPEGFNAFDELREAGRLGRTQILAIFCAAALLGPLMAWLGYSHMQDHLPALGLVMLFAAGGILYLMFQEIAPEVQTPTGGRPALGAVAGFLVGLAGELFIG